MDELSTLARRQGSVIRLLERRILMLEDALQRERGISAGCMPALSDMSVSGTSSSGLGSGRAGSSVPL